MLDSITSYPTRTDAFEAIAESYHLPTATVRNWFYRSAKNYRPHLFHDEEPAEEVAKRLVHIRDVCSVTQLRVQQGISEAMKQRKLVRKHLDALDATVAQLINDVNLLWEQQQMMWEEGRKWTLNLIENSHVLYQLVDGSPQPRLPQPSDDEQPPS